MTAHAPGTPLPAIELRFLDIERWSSGNAGIPYVWTYEAPRPGPHTLIQALTHGNEVCGAIALDWALRKGITPQRGRLTYCFANVEAYQGFDAADPFASRCVQEDFNRLWSSEVLHSARSSAELKRARELQPVYDTADLLLDLHSMTDPCPALAMAGSHAKGIALARGLGVPEHIVVDRGHAAGKRLRDYAFFDDPDDARAALLVECGQHWERAAAKVAQEVLLRFLAHSQQLEPALALPPPEAPQRVLQVTDAITITSEDFGFVMPVQALGVVERAGTVLARDGDKLIRTPYDRCVLVMPTRRPRIGETAVRLARYID
ncbi:MAG TPA: succinylglutamate desuccinylase/aspartoacylase family protein [Casimicrobiaceae bacterium]|nr:succinylglutamate desuccinylase/aspartoacylase family protein [Casimicrobiaceae bacterium]